MQLPKLLKEEQIRPFNYYWQNDIRSGMWANGHLYALLGCFEAEERAIAFEKGCRLADKGDVVLTVSASTPARYRLWIALSNQTDIEWLVKTKRLVDCRTTTAIAV